MGILDIFRMVKEISQQSEVDRLIFEKCNRIDKFIRFVDECKEDIMKTVNEDNHELEGQKVFHLQNQLVNENIENVERHYHIDNGEISIAELMLATSMLLDTLRDMSDNDDISLYVFTLKQFDDKYRKETAI